MKLDATFLRSRFGRRIFVLFACCALIPILVLSFFSLQQVTEELSDQSRGRLKQLSKAEGLAIYDRLLLLEAKILTVATALSAVPAIALQGNDTFKHGIPGRVVPESAG